MKVQSVNSSSFYLQPEVKAKVFREGQEANPTDVKSQLPGQAQAGDGANEDTGLQSLPEAVEQANRTLETYGTELRFRIHEKSGEVQVKVIDVKNDSVLREIPPTQVLNFVADIKKMLGIIIDKYI